MEKIPFTWIEFYAELAKAILIYKDDRKPLVDWIYNDLSKIKGHDGKSFVDFIKNEDESKVNDIDPFSVFAIFNRGTTYDNRKRLLQVFKDFFELKAEVPSDFNGIPVVDSRRSFFFHWGELQQQTIKTLWAMFEKAVNGQSYEHEYQETIARSGIKFNITMALFWVTPNNAVALDSKNRDFLAAHGYEIDRVPSYEEYQDLIYSLKQTFEEGTMDGLSTFPELSYTAWIGEESSEGARVWMWLDLDSPFDSNILGAGDSVSKDIKDFNAFKDYKSMRAAVQKSRGTTDVSIPYAYWQIMNEVCVDDYIVVFRNKRVGNENHHLLLGWGKVTREFMNDQFSNKPIQIGVDWKEILDTPVEDKLTRNSLFFHGTTAEQASNIFRLLGIKDNTLTVTDMETECEFKYYDEIAGILKNKKNVILQGAPGTGKTHAIPEVVARLCDAPIDTNDREAVMNFFKKQCEEKKVVFCTFHQSMDYEDFIEGLRPEVDTDGNVQYNVKDGIFKEICEAAAKPVILNNDLNINPDATIWKVSLASTYENAVRTDCHKNGYIRIGWDQYGPNINEDTNYHVGGRSILDAFINKMKEGDIVMSCYTSKLIDAIGVVTGEYEWRGEFDEYKRVRKVNWLVKGIKEDISILMGTTMTLSTVYRLNRLTIDNVLDILKKHNVANNTSTEANTAPYVIVIDEINRGNISKIFGELITLLEADKRSEGKMPLSVNLPYSNKPFSIPSNLYVIGTMNTADRSLNQFDYAMRRRFAFFPMLYGFTPIKLVDNQVFDKDLFKRVAELFIEDFDEYIQDPNKRVKAADCFSPEFNPLDMWIGPSYFIYNSDDESERLSKICYEIIPTLEQYIADGVFVDTTTVEEFIDEIKDEIL